MLAAGLAWTPMASAQLLDEDEGNQPENGSAVLTAGRATFSQTEFDFGDIFDNEKQVFSTTITNDGVGDLKIHMIKPSCGCTTMEPVRDKVLKPGESYDVRLQFDPAKKMGNIRQNVTITTSDPENSSHTIFFSANVKQLIMAEPHMLSFGQIEKRENKTLEMQILGRIPEFDIPMVSGGEDYFTVEVGDPEAVEIEGEKLYQVILKVTTKQPRPLGQINETLTIRTTDERRPFKTFVATGQAIGDVRVSPSRLPLGLVKTGTEFERELKLTNAQGENFSLRSVGLKDPGAFGADVSFEMSPPLGTPSVSYRVKLLGSAPANNRFLKGELVFETDIEDERFITVPVHGTVRK